MAINANVLLEGIVPDVIGAAKKGFDFGTSIRNAPLLNRINEQKVAQNEQLVTQGGIDEGQAIALGVFQLNGDNPVTADNFEANIRQLQKLNIPLQEDDLVVSEQNIADFEKLRLMGKQSTQSSTGANAAALKGTVGKFNFIDENENLFTSTTFVNPNDQTSRSQLTDATGRGIVPGNTLRAVNELGQTVSAQRQSKADTEQNIVDIKNSGAAEGEVQKKLGVERGKISEDIRQGARESRSAKSNLLRLKRALSAVETGRLSVAQDLMGSFIPGVKDADAETFNSLATQYALDELSRQSGTKTDFDFQKAAETQARLGNTKAANEDILTIALDRIDEIEDEERQFKNFTSKGHNAEDFRFKAVPIEFIQFVRKNPTNEKAKKDFKDKYGFLPTGL